MFFKLQSKVAFASRVYVNSANNSTFVSFVLLPYFNRAMNYYLLLLLHQYFNQYSDNRYDMVNRKPKLMTYKFLVNAIHDYNDTQ